MIVKVRFNGMVCTGCGAFLNPADLDFMKFQSGCKRCSYCGEGEKEVRPTDILKEKQAKEYLKLIGKKRKECGGSLYFETPEIIAKYNKLYEELGIPRGMRI